MNSDHKNPFDYFEGIFCINLDSRPERWVEAQAEFEKLGIKHRVERVSGVICEDPREGFARAHLNIIDHAKRSHLSNCLIFEDDLWVQEETIGLLSPAIGEIMNLDWDLFYTGGTTVTPAYQTSPHLAKATGVYTTHSYAISDRMFDTILNSWHPPQIYDVFLAEEIASKHECYMTIPLIIYQKAGFSDIEHRTVDYKQMMDRNYARDLVWGADGKEGIWRLPTKRVPKRESPEIGE